MSGALAGLRVLDLARYRAGVLLGAILADHGADVVRLGATPRTDLGWAERGRARIDLDPESVAGRAAVQALAERADVILDEATWEVPCPPTAVRVRLPPRAGAVGEPAYEGPISAFAGLYDAPLRRAPSYSPLAVTSLIAALYGGIGLLAALRARMRDGRGQTVEAPLLDAALSALELTALLTDDAPTRWSPVRWAASPFLRFWRCADGEYLYVHAGMPHHAAKLIQVLSEESPGFPDLRLSEAAVRDPSNLPTVAEARRVVAAFQRAFQAREASAWEARLGREGLCAVQVRALEAWLDHPHARAAGHVVGTAEDCEPGVPICLSATPGGARAGRVADVAALWSGPSPWETPLGSPVSAPPLDGLTVLDATQVIAGPTAARTLAELGARVLRVENPRLAAGWVEPFHTAFNTGKHSAIHDLSGEAGRAELARVLERERPDLLIESFRRGKAGRLGLDAAREARSDLIVASITAYGPGGPWEGLPGWEQTAQAATGMAVDRGGSGPPALVPLPICDFATGLSGALGSLLALLGRERGGGGQDVAVSLAGTALWVQAPYAWRAGGVTPGRARGEDQRGAGPLCRFVVAADAEAFVEGAWSSFAGVEGLSGVDPGDLAAVDRAFRRAPVAVWQARLAGRDVTLLPRRSLASALRDPAVRARGVARRERVPAGGAVTLTGPGLVLDRTPLVQLPVVSRGSSAWIGEPPRDLPAVREPGRVAWLLEQARWALFLRAGW